MPPEKHEPDEDKSAARTPEMRAEMEAAWLHWSHAMKDVDVEPRMLLLLRAAFQAGYEARR